MRKPRALTPGFSGARQVTTRVATVGSIMRSAPFVEGFKAARAGKPIDYEAYRDNTRQQWHYERGRLLALVYDGPLKAGRELIDESVRAYIQARKEGVIG